MSQYLAKYPLRPIFVILEALLTFILWVSKMHLRRYAWSHGSGCVLILWDPSVAIENLGGFWKFMLCLPKIKYSIIKKRIKPLFWDKAIWESHADISVFSQLAVFPFLGGRSSVCRCCIIYPPCNFLLTSLAGWQVNLALFLLWCNALQVWWSKLSRFIYTFGSCGQ